MKKHLIAAAVAGAFAVPAMAQVTVYGRVDMGWGTATTKASCGTQDKTSGLVDGTQTSNAIGFRGTEDLGGGLTAGFQLEQGISPTQTNGWNMRTANSGHQVANGTAISSATMRVGALSLRGAFGLVEVGTLQWSAGYAVASRWGFTAEGFGGEFHAVATGMPARITGASWTSPAFSGTTLTLQHGGAHGNRVDRESVADAPDGLRRNKHARTGMNIQHSSGPLYVGVAYESTAVQATANSAATTNAYGGAVAVGSAIAARTEQAWAIAANYDLGPVVLRGGIVDRDNGASGSDNRKTAGTGLSVAVPLGALTLTAVASQYETKTPTAKTLDVSGHQFNARYNLSKRTNVYLHYGTDKDKGSSVTATTLAKRTRTVAGLVHTF